MAPERISNGIAGKRRRISSAGERNGVCKPGTSRQRASLPSTSTNVGEDDPEVKEIIRQMEVTRHILGMDYIDVVNRFKLSWVPYCVADQQYCRSHHHRRCPRPKVVNDLQSSCVGTFLKQNRVMHYLRSVQDMCIRMEFPGEDVLRKILEAILISRSDGSTYSTEYFLQQCIVVAETIVLKFPPCWPDINRAYRDFLKTNLDLKKHYYYDGASAQNNVFAFLLDVLLETILTPDDRSKANNDTDEDDESDEEGMDHFIQHTREEKLDRIFVVLNILTKILEYDFPIWLLRYPTKTKEKMFLENAPLLAQVFFDGSYNFMTRTVKKLLEVFAISVCHHYPSDKVDVLSRIVSLLSLAVSCIESQPYDQVLHPNVGSNTKTFVDNIFKAVVDRFGYRIDYLLIMVDAIKIPSIRYLYVDFILRKMNVDREEMNVKKIHTLFERQRWRCTEGTRQRESTSSDQKYRIMPPKKNQRPKASEIYAQEYLEIVLKSLQAYCETFQIRRVIREVYMNKSDVLSSKKVKCKEAQKVKPLKPLDLDKIEADINILENQLKRKATFVPKSLEEQTYTNIHVDSETMSRYREDVKYLGILLCTVKKLLNEEGPIFQDFYCFLNKMLNTDD
ncbi:unnamed protein product [Hermetia illucens]|uniref:Uncharacterized protein n=2 Tax=Hermetia illucens TaxID=343691 RepID=A0A7R8UH11_HERIL|nr:unnamed protein product [Hermetia illucens]